MSEKALKPIEHFRRDLEAYKPQLARVLPAHISPERFTRVCETAAAINPDLIVKADIPSLFAACIRLAEMGLYPDGREAALVIFDGKVQAMPMIAGLIKLARNSGDIATLSAHVVYSNDHFEYELGDEERLRHVPKLGDRGEPVQCYAIVRLKDGSIQREVMDKDQVEAVQAVSRAKSQKSPWVTWPDEMWRKTVLRRLLKFVPRSTDKDGERLQKAEDADNDTFDLSVSAPAKVTPLPAKPRQRRLEMLKEDGSTEPVTATPPPQARQEPQEEEPEPEVREEPPPPPVRQEAPPKPAPATPAPAKRVEVELVDVVDENGEPMSIAVTKTEKIKNALNASLRQAARSGSDELEKCWRANQHLKAVLSAEDWQTQVGAQRFRVESLSKSQGVAQDYDDEPPEPLGDE